MRLLGLLIGALVFAFPTSVVAQAVSRVSLIGTWVKVEADSERQYWDPSTGNLGRKKDYPNGNVDGKIPVDYVLTLRSDSTKDIFGMAGEKNVWGMSKGEGWCLEGEEITFLCKKSRPGGRWKITLQGEQLSITDIIPGRPPELWGVFKKYADTTAPYGALQRSAGSPKP